MGFSMKQKPENLVLSVPSHPKYLQLVRKMVKKITAIIGISKPDAADIILAVDEACANSIRHGYKNKPHGMIHLYFEVHATKLAITIEDFGCPWDPAARPPRDLEEIRPGGLGIHMMQCVMDCVDFDCDAAGTGNRVKMVKRFNPREKP
jgi:anti-sigma regulatory factor (Ser/Thr protein kinase)